MTDARYLAELAKADRALAATNEGLNGLIAIMRESLGEFDPTRAWGAMILGAEETLPGMTKDQLVRLLSAAVLRLAQAEGAEQLKPF